MLNILIIYFMSIINYFEHFNLIKKQISLDLNFKTGRMKLNNLIQMIYYPKHNVTKLPQKWLSELRIIERLKYNSINYSKSN